MAPTDKQRKFLFRLCKELGVQDIDAAMESFSALSVQEASAKIDELLAQREE